MNFSQLKYCFLGLVLILVSCQETPVDWRPTFDSKDKIPYGTYVLRNELKNIFPYSYVENIKTYTGQYLESNKYEGWTDTYIFIHPEQFHDDQTWTSIVDIVNLGGNAMISTRNANKIFQDYLKLNFDEFKTEDSNPAVKLSVKTNKAEYSNVLQKGVFPTYISEFDPETTEVLGYVEFNQQKKPNFIKVHFGKGYFLIHTEPYAFTNYHMLRDDNYKYVTDVLSYVEDEPILWDNHRMHFRDEFSYNNGGFFSALSFIFKHQSLAWAFMMLLLMGFLYLVFNSKRKQNAIKIIEPYTNNTLTFAQTLSELYKNNADHTAITKYRINYFLDQLKVRYNISSKEMENDFSELLSAKSGVEQNLCNKLVLTIDIFRSRNYLDKEDFFKLQELIQSFNQKSGNYGRTTHR